MKELKLKVCGMREIANIMSVAELRPDYMGFIFYEKSPRYVGDVFQIPREFPLQIRKVGVFADHQIDLILKLANLHEFDLIQLHGSQTPDQCRTIRQQGFGVIKAFGVDSSLDMKETHPYCEAVDYFLFDTHGPGYGGHGKVFDWELLKRYEGEVPFFLSGGLSAENLGLVEAMDHPQLFGVDLNSGVEESAGKKDIELLKKAKAALLH